jgi:hypothetical protein
MLKRRAVLGALGSVMAASFMPVNVLAGTRLSQRNQYSRLIGSRIRFRDAEGSVTTARLVALDDGPQCPGLEQFSVVFEGEHLGEGVYEIFHPDMGNSRLAFTASGRPGPERNLFRAYFSNFI